MQQQNLYSNYSLKRSGGMVRLYEPIQDGINLFTLNKFNDDFKYLFDNLGTATETKTKIENFLNGSQVVTRNMLANAAVGASQIDNEAVTGSKIPDNQIGRRHVLDNTINADKVADGSLGATELSVDAATINSGKNYPLVNYDVDGVETTIAETHRKGILDAKVTGADVNKVYRLSSIRHGYSGSFGMNVDEFDLDTNRNIDTTTRRRVITHVTSVYPTFATYNYGKTVGVMTARREDGLVVTVKFDYAEVGTILNIAENSLGASQGAIIDPSNYEYKIVAQSEETVNFNNMVVVDKNENDMIIYLKNSGNLYTGYHMYRVTTPWQEGNQRSNLDLWSIGRVSAFLREGDTFTEDPNKVYIYSNISEPTYTNDTIFRLAGASDYSGGFYHGDEKIQSFYITIGNADITNRTGQFDGETLELMQHTHIYRDTSTSTTGETTAFLSVKKTHRFNQKEGYTLNHPKIEALENFTPTFSSVGGWQMNRKFESGADNNILDAYDLTNIDKVNLRVADSVDKHFTGQGTMEYKIVGFYKDIVMTYENNSDYFDTWLRNWAANEMKIYSKIFEDNKEVAAGTTVNASLNYKFTSY